MITSEEAKKLSIQFRKNSLQLNTELKLFGVRRVCQKDVYNLEHDKLDKYITQQENVENLLKEHIQLSYDFEYMLVHGIKYDMKYTKTANRLLTVREKLHEILNWKLESEHND
ncbi:MAG: hypothetical protein M0R03_17425 [Novosphingobium sp.]|nr:hypothetical protein [Novosphingobium sp.]